MTRQIANPAADGTHTLSRIIGALDAKVRKKLRQWLRELHQQTGVTTLFATHDQEEALELADRVVIMSGGEIAQVGCVDEVYERPASPLVFDFLGNTKRCRHLIPSGWKGSAYRLVIPHRLAP